jgi:hypothetical protein
MRGASPLGGQGGAPFYQGPWRMTSYGENPVHWASESQRG